MKDQYFGDARDYFKYDVLDTLSRDLSSIDQLTCLWMLTRPDGTGQGRVMFVPDPKLPELTSFFRERLQPRDEERSRVSEMRNYFATRPYGHVSYRDDRDDFGTATRSEYFVQVPDEALTRAVIFFDPDNGMEPARATEQHLRFAELVGVLDRMNPSSVAVIFQYRRRESDFWNSMGRRLHDETGRPVAYIADGHLAFYTLAASEARRDEAAAVLGKIRDRDASRRRVIGLVG